MLEGKALVVAIMMLTAAPLVVTDDGRAIVGDVTSDVTDMFTVEEAAEDPKLDELLDDAVDKSELSELEKEKKQVEVVTKEAVSYTHLRAHETGRNGVCRLLL